jgi:hypothetical protein
MKPNKNINVAAPCANNVSSQQTNMYDVLLRAVEMDIENVKMAAGTGTVVPLVSPAFSQLLDSKQGENDKEETHTEPLFKEP